MQVTSRALRPRSEITFLLTDVRTLCRTCRPWHTASNLTDLAMHYSFCEYCFAVWQICSVVLSLAFLAVVPAPSNITPTGDRAQAVWRRPLLAEMTKLAPLIRPYGDLQ